MFKKKRKHRKNIIIGKYDNYHVSLDISKELESAILEKEYNKVGFSLFFKKLIFQFFRNDKWTGKLKPLRFIFKWTGNFFTEDYFIVMMGFDPMQTIPFFLGNGKKYVYLFDAWPKTHFQIIYFANEFKVNYIFLTSSMSAELLNQYKTRCKFIWIPEGISEERYKYYSFSEKSIDIIQFGRKNNLYHELIKNEMSGNNITYLFQENNTKLLFDHHNDFSDALAKSKISICFPSSITHPERAEGIETMTIRYLQSMLSKCLIVGNAPSEMIEMFGYNPIIEVDMNNPVKQIMEILNNYSEYWNLVEKNYESVLKNHTWSSRWDQMEKIINNSI